MTRRDLWVLACSWTCLGINLGMIALSPGHPYWNELAAVVTGTVAAIKTAQLGKSS